MSLEICEEKILDSFAGGGGASTGIELAIGRIVDYAINHDPAAILMHKTNHPFTAHYQASVWDVWPDEVLHGSKLGLAFPNISDAIKVMEAWGFTYKTAAFVWVKKNSRSGGDYMGLGAYTRANAEVCFLGVTKGFKPKERVKSHAVHQIVEAPVSRHSEKPDEVRRRIVELLGDVPRIELFARELTPGWDAWGDEV